MTDLAKNATGFYYINNVLYPKNHNFTIPLNGTNTDVKIEQVLRNDTFVQPGNSTKSDNKFVKRKYTNLKKSANKLASAKTRLVISAKKDPRKIHKKGHDDHGHESDHHEHDHHHHEDHHKYHEHGHKVVEHHHKCKHGHGGHGHKHIKHIKEKGGKHKKYLYPVFIGLLTAKAIILPLVLKMLAFWSAKGLLLGMIATIMASILSLKKMIEPHYKIEGKKDEGTKIELVSLPVHHERVHHHHPKHYEYSAEGAESQNNPYGAYY